MKLAVGQAAPDFSLPDQDGAVRVLSSYRGTWVLLYFYPKDDTPGCTKEACAIRDSFPNFGALDAVVLGVSTDSIESHKKFALKHNLPFNLLSDEKKEVVKAYDVWAPKTFMGKELFGTLRTSFLIDPSGRIAKIYEGVKPETHAGEVLGDLKQIASRT